MTCVFLTNEFGKNNLFDYLSNWTSSQVEKKFD
jgi:hypothetical protein